MQPPLHWPAQTGRISCRYLDEPRIQSGAAFVRNHQAAMQRAQHSSACHLKSLPQYRRRDLLRANQQVTFARSMLDHAVVRLLRRAEYYREQLAEFFLLVDEQKSDPLIIKGSFAGAIGLPQFMPGSIRRYAVDFDDDGRIDLSGSPIDAIGSVASYLAAHGWQRDLPIVFDAVTDEATVDALGRGLEASVPWSAAAAAGVEGDIALALDEPVLVIDLPYVAGGTVERLYRVGTVNFSALLRYNRSYFYASAVVDLARAIAATVR